MSGLVGIYYPNKQQVEPKKLQKMLDILIHRGSDDVNFWCLDNIGVGHRMLWTTPESLVEKLPEKNATGELIITADARIDNRNELITTLQIDNSSPEKITDSQLILAAYERWGETCPDKLLGDFAFAIWNQRQQQLFCARDHFGIKPFYYYYQPGCGFIFASEIKAITGLTEVPVEINEVRIGDYLTSTLEDTAITSYQNIWRLPPAHTLTINSQDSLKLNRYWFLKPGAEIKYESDLEYAEKFREIFTEAVRCRLRSAFPVGSHLSGGLDSSSVTCVARDLLQQEGIELHTFSNIFDSVPECNERTYIEKTLTQGGFTPHYVHADTTGPLSEWEQFFTYSDESLIGNGYLIWGLNRATKEAGVRIVLNGFDGDTTVSHGILRLTELARAEQWNTFLNEGIELAKNFQKPPHLVLRSYGLEALKQLAREGRWLAFIKAVNTIYTHVKLSRRKLIVNCGLKALFSDNFKKNWRKLRRGKSAVSNPFPLIDPDFAQRIELQQRLSKFDRSDNPPLTVKEHHWHQLTSGLMTIPLEGLDCFSAAFSIESRHPFMDKRLIEYCLALPAEQKLSRGWSRIVLRRAMENILPSEIQWRGDKSDLGSSFNKGLLEFNKKILEDVMLHKSELISNFIDTNKLSNIYNSSISQNKIKGNTIDNIWSTISLSLWLCKMKK